MPVHAFAETQARAFLRARRLRVDLRPEAAEGVGVFLLVLAGGMAAASAASLGSVGVALTFVFTVAVLVAALGHVSGAHLNPAVTLAFAVTGHFPWARVGTYVAAQAAGAVAAALLVRAVTGAAGLAALTVPAAGVTPLAAFGVEVVATFLLAFVVVAVSTDPRAGRAGAYAIGLAVGAGALFAGGATGGSMNPARSLGPALAYASFDAVWIYLLAPAVGAVAAMALYGWLRNARKPGEEP